MGGSCPGGGGGGGCSVLSQGWGGGFNLKFGPLPPQKKNTKKLELLELLEVKAFAISKVYRRGIVEGNFTPSRREVHTHIFFWGGGGKLEVDPPPLKKTPPTNPPTNPPSFFCFSFFFGGGGKLEVETPPPPDMNLPYIYPKVIYPLSTLAPWTLNP